MFSLLHVAICKFVFNYFVSLIFSRVHCLPLFLFSPSVDLSMIYLMAPIGAQLYPSAP